MVIVIFNNIPVFMLLNSILLFQLEKNISPCFWKESSAQSFSSWEIPFLFNTFMKPSHFPDLLKCLCQSHTAPLTRHISLAAFTMLSLIKQQNSVIVMDFVFVILIMMSF